MADRVSLRAYAMHRDCALRAVQKAIETGRLSEPAFGRDAQGRLEWIDVELADQQWKANTDPAAAAKAGKEYTSDGRLDVVDREGLTPSGPRDGVDDEDTLDELDPVDAAPEDLVAQAAADPGAPAAAPAAAPLATSSSSSDYQKSRAQREHYAAEQAKLDYFKNRGELVSAADVRDTLFKRYRALRDKFLNIPDRVATILAAERDPVRVHAALTDEIERVLSDFSTESGADATGGASERLAA